MKKLLFAVGILTAIISCKNDSENDVSENNQIQTNATVAGATSRLCASEEIRQELLSTDANALRRYNELENLSLKIQKQAGIRGKISSATTLLDGTVEIPVVFNVIYNTKEDSLSDAVLNEQIDILNKDFSATNSDIKKIPKEFDSLAAGDIKIKFKLAAINRKKSKKNGWLAKGDSMKLDSRGGIDATEPLKNLNIWVVNSMPTSIGETLGYSTFPESAGKWNDGVVLARKYVGKTGASAPFNLGRTATHEVGHYFNLKHIWGDGSGCATDFCDDTPLHPKANTGKPKYPLYGTCGRVKRSLMFMNYMDYCDDASLYMFTANQKTRMQTTLIDKGPRESLKK